MANPSVTAVIGSGGTAAAGTSLVLTLSAGAVAGHLVLLTVGTSTTAGTLTAADSRGNTYISLAANAGTPGVHLLGALVIVPLIATDTITVTSTNTVGISANALDVAAASWSSAVAATQIGGIGSAVGTSPAGTAFTPYENDSLMIMICSFNASAAADFSSIDSSYTIRQSSQTSAGTGASVSIATKAVTAAHPMVSQNPTFTLANSRTWKAIDLQLSGLTARTAPCLDMGAIGSALAPTGYTLAGSYTAAALTRPTVASTFVA